VLDAATLDDALALLRDTPRASGFHHTLGGTDATGAVRVVSVEATARRASVVEIGAPSGHANHLIHADHPDGEREPQIVTDSSRDRQARLADLLPPLGAHPDGEVFVQTLHDRGGAGLPIFRDDPHDPDDENTLATACMRIEPRGVALDVWQGGERVMSQQIARI
jgi:hypothetical protein